MVEKKTKIICTLGPSSKTCDIIEKIIKNGMNVARINFSHGTHEANGKLIKNVYNIAKKLKKNIAVMADLQGPKIRLGDFDDTKIKKGDDVIFTPNENRSDFKKKIFPIQYKNLWKDVNKGDILKIADGLFEFEIKDIKNEEIFARVLNGGILKKRKGINCPNSTISAYAVTKKDKEDLKYALSIGVNIIAISFVRHAKDIEYLRKIAGENIFVIAKIERREAMENLEEIACVSDALMVARGDLSVEIDFEDVPFAQKKITKLGNAMGKPVITATQVFYSMVSSPRPTRAEVSDAANAVFDFCDCVMLSDETASGQYPVRTVNYLSRVIKKAEDSISFKKFHANKLSDKISDESAIALASCKMAEDTGTDKIAIFSEVFSTFVQVLRHRPPQEIFCFVKDEKVIKQLAMVWGGNNIISKFSKSKLNSIFGDKEIVVLERNVKGKNTLSFQIFEKIKPESW